MGARLPIAAADLSALCARHHVHKLSLFGSELKGTARPDSDVDLLVEFEPGARITLVDMARIENELSALLGGRRVDLRTAGDLSRYFRDEVVRTAEVQYVATTVTMPHGPLRPEPRGQGCNPPGGTPPQPPAGAGQPADGPFAALRPRTRVRLLGPVWLPRARACLARSG